jgi:hypothetical protein
MVLRDDRRRQVLVGDLLDDVVLDVELAGIAMDADLRDGRLVARHLHDVVAGMCRSAWPRPIP